MSDEYRRLMLQPALLREECLILAKKAAGPPVPIVLDEVQKVPDLLDEVHWLIENTDLQFILCGSSARKLWRGQGNLLGGRALRYELFPWPTGVRLLSWKLTSFSATARLRLKSRELKTPSPIISGGLSPSAMNTKRVGEYWFRATRSRG
jgi:predicted AAA+ superfamily ATPase